MGFTLARSHGCAAQLSRQVAEVGDVPFCCQVLARSQASAVQILAGRRTLAIASLCELGILMLGTA